MTQIAALYVAAGGAYFGLEGVDPWDETRDARLYEGPFPVVAHPPCNVWCQLAHVNQARYGIRVGDDGGCFARALDIVRRFGGVLEHPAFSCAWEHFKILRPVHGCWKRDMFSGEWVTQVAQSAYGHRARKLTWLIYVGTEPPALDWSRPEADAQVSYGKKAGGGYWREPLTKKQAKASPPAFRDLLISMARGSR